MNAVRANLSDEMRQIKIGLLVWALIWIVNKAIVHMTLLALPSSSFAAVDLLLKTLNFIASIVLMVYVIRIWQWDLDDWGFTYDLGFWVALLVTCVYVGYFWYMEGLPTDFGTRTIRQALTGIWEELISTVFFTLLLTKYFRTLPRLSAVSAKTLAVVISAIVFTLIHYGQWTRGSVGQHFIVHHLPSSLCLCWHILLRPRDTWCVEQPLHGISTFACFLRGRCDS